MTEPVLWDIKSTAAQLGVSVALVRRMVADNQIPYCRVASRVRFQPEAIRAWVAEREIKAVK